jgi:hypothetical protein
MSDALDKLHTLENNIYTLGDKIYRILEKINSVLNGEDFTETNERNLNLEEIVKFIHTLKEDMHKQVEEVYKDKNFPHMTKSYNDILEQVNALNDIRSKIKFN